MRHYDSNVVLTSPSGNPGPERRVRNRKRSASLRSYFKRGLELYPNLQFELIDVPCGLSSIVASRPPTS